MKEKIQTCLDKAKMLCADYEPQIELIGEIYEPEYLFLESRLEELIEFCLNLQTESDTEKLCRFFKFFRDNGKKMIGLSIDMFVDEFIKQDKK